MNNTNGNRDNFFKPSWVIEFEDRLARIIPPYPKTISSIKLVIVFLMFMSLSYRSSFAEKYPSYVFVLFLVFVLLDYLSGIVARATGKEKSFGRIMDRLTDFPLVVILCWFNIETLPYTLLALKIAIDALLLALYLMQRGSPVNRFRTGINYSTYLAMLFIYKGMTTHFITPETVSYLLISNIVFFSIAALYNLNVLQKRFIADILSAANLLCGVFSMIFAAKGRLEISLMFLMLGAAFDGFDGAAARKWGGTRWGVYSDDVADAVNYGIAPGFALWAAMRGVEGWILGPFFTIFVLSRLIFFTLNKASSDPNYFRGVPSTIGGIVTLCSLVLFKDYPAITGLMVGVACVQMVSFDTSYRHLGRALSDHREALFGMPFLLIILIGGELLYGVAAPVAMILVACLAYGFRPSAIHLIGLIRRQPSA